MTTPTPVLLDAVDVRQASVADGPELLALHRAAFASTWSLDQWRWRYAHNPLRAATIVGAFTANGACVAAFCGVPLRCTFRGEPGIAVRAGDVAVHPLLRGSMAASTVLLRTSDAFFRSAGGGAARIVFGFPEPGLARTIVRHCRVDVLGDVLWLVRPVTADVVATGTALHGETFPDDVDALFAACSGPGDTGLVRDAAYLRWRYAREAGAGPVSVVGVRTQDGALRGLCVTKTNALQRDALFLAEWLCPPGDDATARVLLAGADACARRLGLRSLVASFAPASAPFAAFQSVHGFRVLGSHYQFVYRSYATAIDRRFLLDHWSHALGDLDFV